MKKFYFILFIVFIIADNAFAQKPTISYFTPTSGSTGTVVSIVGTNLHGVDTVSIGGEQFPFTIVNDTLIHITIGYGPSGAIRVADTAGSDALDYFTYINLPPVISYFTPQTGMTGTQVYIYGQHLFGATSVTFGGTAPSYVVIPQDTLIIATVDTGSTGMVKVVTPGGSSSLGTFTYQGTAVIHSFTPLSGGTGTTITIHGKNFTGITAVSFGGIPAASFTLFSDTAVSAVVGAGNSGLVSVTTATGVTTLGTFTFITSQPPVIHGFTPDSANTGVAVTITGQNFTGTTSVSFGDSAANSFTVISDTIISAVIGTGATGAVSITTPKGSVSKAGFVYTAVAVASFSPAKAGPGDIVKIVGKNLTGASAVSFGGTAATSFSVTSDSTILAVVALGTSGPVSVSAPGGTATLGGFTFIPPVPVVSGFARDTAIAGDTVTIKGKNFRFAGSVNFGITPAASFTIISDSVIEAVLATGSSGAVTVTSIFGTGLLAGFTFIPPAVIASFNPAIAGTGDTVFIYGLNLATTDSVSFGGARVASFTIVSDTIIAVKIGTGYSGNLRLVTRAGFVIDSGFTFSTIPTITSFTPLYGPVGTTVTITGKNFSPVAANDIIYFGTEKALVSSATSTSLKVIVPAGSTYQPISVTTNTLTGYSNLPFSITFPAADSAFQPTSFASKQDIPTGQAINDVAIGDLDGDGKPDLASAHNYGDGQAAATYQNTSTGGVISFGSGTVYQNLPAGFATQLSLTDINGSGKQDLTLAVGADQYPISIFKNNSIPGSFAFSQNNFFGANTILGGYRIATADFDGDGRPDIVILGSYQNAVAVYRNTSSQGVTSYAAPLIIISSTIPMNVITTDIDGDGKPDFLVVGPSKVAIFRNTGSLANIAFAPETDLATGGSSADDDGIAAGDLNGDGKPDIAIASGDIMKVSLFQNNSTPGVISFGVRKDYPYDDNVIRIKIADLDGDGKPDLITASQNLPKISVYKNNSTAAGISMMPKVDFATGNNPSAVSIGDLDGDGKPDIAVANSGSATISILKNLINNQPLPVITSFSPDTAATGATVTIKGKNLAGVLSVTLGGIPVGSFVIKNDSVITSVVAAGLSGYVMVASPNGADSLPNFHFTEPAPVISSFDPQTADINTPVTITGKNFTAATQVYFGTEPAQTFSVSADSVITATPGAGASGNVTVITPYGTGSLPGFVYMNNPGIVSISPVSANMGSLITITGAGFTGAYQVFFGNFPAASFTVVSDTLITAVVSYGATGAVQVRTPGGTAYYYQFNFTTPLPVINSISPDSAGFMDTVTIKGKYFTNTESVTFGGMGAYEVITLSDSVIEAIVHHGASGDVGVTTRNGTSYFPGFVFLSAGTQTITSFVPLYGSTGTFVTIRGTGFTGTTSVSFGSVAAASFTIVSDSVITAIVGTGASGNIAVTNPSGTQSIAGFTFISISNINSFAPDTATAGTSVSIYGTHFTGATGVSFGAVQAASFTVVSDSLITAIVGSGASGSVTVTVPGDTVSLFGFVYKNAAITKPVINSFTPDSASAGAVVSIKGAGFTGATAVSFGDSAAASFTVVSDSLITATVGSGSSGNVVVIVPGDTLSLPGFVYTTSAILKKAAIYGFTPDSATAGTVISVKGTGFTGATSVSFGDSAASSYTVVSDSLITATIQNGASGNVVIIVPGDTLSLGGFVYLSPVTVIKPVIDSFTPDSASKGTVVSVKGAGFTGATAVSFGDSAASSFTVVSDSLITATVGSGASGNIVVITPADTASLAGFIYLLPLPDSAYKLIQFAGTLSANQVLLVWQAKNERGISHYTVQQSGDSLSFLSLGNVNSLGISGITDQYNFTDSLPPFQVTYYRLEIADTAGNITYSQVIKIALTPVTNVKIYPNPASSYVIIEHPAVTGSAAIEIIDATGRKSIIAQVNAGVAQSRIALTGLTAGVYTVVWTDGKSTFSQGLIIR